MSRLVQLSLLVALALMAGCASQPPGTLTTIGQVDGSMNTLYPYRPPYYYRTAQGLVYYCPRGGAPGGSCSAVNNFQLYNYQPSAAYQPQYQPPPPTEPQLPPPQSGGNWLIPSAQAGTIRPTTSQPSQPSQPAPLPPGAAPGDVPVDNKCGWWRLDNLWGCSQP
jgi:hypothetical protein